MPSTLPGSFASAAAGNISESSGRPYPRAEPGAFADWTRRPNGATQTFRRSSSTTASSAQTNPRDSNSNPSPASAYVPPHVSASRNGSAVDTRYSKSQLLDLFREQRDMGDLDDDLTDFYVGDALSGLNNGIPTPKWGRREESKNEYGAPGPDICWERGGSIEPLALVDMSEEEKELFANSVNSPLKGPSQSVTRDGAPREAALGRKISVSHSQAAAHSFGLSSPTATRTTTRRRDTNDSYPFPRDSTATISATNSTLREDPSDNTSPSVLLRRKTDALETAPDRHNEVEAERDTTGSIVPGFGSSFGSFKRSVTNPLGTGSSGSPSNWPASSQNSAVSTLGAFGNLGLGSQPTNSGPKRPDLGPSRESRFRGLMNKGKPEGKSEGPQEKQSIGSIGKLTDESLRSEAPTDISNFFEQTATDDPETLAAEAAIFGSSMQNNRQQESSNLPHQQTGYSGFHRLEDEHRPRELDTSQDLASSRGFDEPHIRDHHTGPSTRNYYQSSTAAPEEPLSPTFTNPYSSPLQQMPALRDIGSDEFDMANLHLPGLGELQNQAIHDAPGTGIYNARRDLNRAPSYDLRQSERSQYPSSNTGRGFPTIGGLGGLGGFGGSEAWPASVGTGTPLREKAQFSDFGGQIAGSAPHLQSPNVAGSDPGTIGRGGRLGSLFPTAMQEQMRIDPAKVQRDERTLPVVSENLDGLAGISSSHRDLESPFRMGGHGKFDDFSASADTGSAFHSREAAMVGDQLNNAVHSSQPPNFGQQQQQYTAQPSAQRTISVINAASNQPPAAQQKTMVMPDRIRWIYRDPQGNTQGPWSGLEMHDWYRAGFFSPELLVKKAEDADYEPLAQLIRRIGNSREPFLVPQIGIPGPPSSQSNTNWPSQTVVSSPSTAAAAAAQPPFAGSFPSFGTTLTAEQQNALERRKQEEQYLMARQKEHLAQQQLHVRQMQGQHVVHPQQLQHHSSAQSLQSQPSYGSMTSPNGFQASPPQNLNHMSTTSATGFESSFRLGGGIGIGPIGSGVDNLGHIREEDHSTFSERASLDQDRKGFSDAQRSMGQANYADGASFEERTAAMLADRALVERQQAEEDYLSQSRDRSDDPLVNERLKEFQEIRMNTDNEGYRDSYKDKSLAKERAPSSGKQSNTEFSLGWSSQIDESQRRNEQERLSDARNLSLTEQVQQAASSKQSPTSSWARADTTAPEAAPPQSASPLPAPAARRGRTNVADTLAAESLSQSQSPVDETPTSSVAPWAKESSETQKQPSLREIQEIEARKAAKLEEIAATSRRAALEREMANQPPPPAPGLPSSSTWGSSESPLSASAIGQFAWAKPTTAKGAAASSGSGKKSLQQIQAEEEAATRKKKASAATNATIATQVTGAAQAMSSGKRYADLAGKNASPTPTGAWTTVGASGKAKGPIATPAPLSGLKSTGSPGATIAAAPTRPKPVTANSKTSLAAAKQNAQDELKRWATVELRPDLDKNIQVDEFVQTLLNFPPDTDMITEVVHQNSSTIDSRHFAEEFTRRRGLAEKGKTDASGASGSHYLPQSNEIKGGGWSEVARKGSVTNTNVTKEEASGAFKIVAGKKKGKR